MSYETPSDIVSYMIGRQVGDQLKGSQFTGFDLSLVIKGISGSMDNDPMPVAQDKVEQAYQVIQEEMKKIQEEQTAKASEEGEAFLTANRTKDGIVTTESGLQFEVLTAGTGKQATLDSTVVTHYHGSLIDGTVFDSSVERGQPAEFPVSGVIAGWTEALQLMQEGAKWRLFIPSNLAYGENGAGASIPPHSALVFEVELITVK